MRSGAECDGECAPQDRCLTTVCVSVPACLPACPPGPPRATRARLPRCRAAQLLQLLSQLPSKAPQLGKGQVLQESAGQGTTQAVCAGLAHRTESGVSFCGRPQTDDGCAALAATTAEGPGGWLSAGQPRPINACASACLHDLKRAALWYHRLLHASGMGAAAFSRRAQGGGRAHQQPARNC